MAGTDARVHAPHDVLPVLDRMFGQVERVWACDGNSVSVFVSFKNDVWNIGGDAPASRKTLCSSSTLPQIAGATVAALLAEIAHERDVDIWRAAVVERGGEAIVLAGDDWESAITLAVHLHARGWSMVSGDYAIMDRETMHALPFRKALHVSSASLAAFPIAYRRAVEASPWYSSLHAIAFYAIDPTIVDGPRAWSDAARVRAVLYLDGRVGEYPSLEAAGNFALSESTSAANLPGDVEIATLIVGGGVETADFVERWFAGTFS